MSPIKNSFVRNIQTEQSNQDGVGPSPQRGCRSKLLVCGKKGKTLKPMSKGNGVNMKKGALALVLILGLASMARAAMCPKVLQAQFCGYNGCTEDQVWDSILVGNFLFVSNMYSLMKINLVTNSIEWSRRIVGIISYALFV